MANETPPPWQTPDPNQQSQPVVLPTKPELGATLPQFTWDQSAVPSNGSNPQIVVDHPPSPVVTPLGANGEVQTIQTAPSAPDTVPQVPSTPPQDSKPSFDPKAFLDSLPVKSDEQQTESGAAEVAPETSLPLEAGAQSIVGGDESSTQSPDNGYPMAPGTEPAPVQDVPKEVASPAVVAQEAPTTDVVPTQPEPIAAAAVPVTPEPAPQAVGTLVNAESTPDTSTTRRNWRKFGDTLTNAVKSVATPASPVPTSAENNQPEEVKPTPVKSAPTESNLSPFGDPLPAQEITSSPKATDAAQLPSKPMPEAQSSNGASPGAMSEIKSTSQVDKPAINNEPTLISPDTDIKHKDSPTQNDAETHTSKELQPLVVTANTENRNEQQPLSPEDQLAEAISNAQKVEEEGLLEAALGKRQYEIGTQKAREAALQIEMLKKMDPTSFVTVKSIYTGNIQPINRHTLEELENAA